MSLCEIILIAITTEKADQHYNGLFFMILSMFSIGLQVAVNIILALVYYSKEDKERAKAFLLSFVVILLVGFPSCFGLGTAMSIR